MSRAAESRKRSTDLCSSSSSSLDIIISRWWERDFPGRYLKEPSSLAVPVSVGDGIYNMVAVRVGCQTLSTQWGQNVQLVKKTQADIEIY